VNCTMAIEATRPIIVWTWGMAEPIMNATEQENKLINERGRKGSTNLLPSRDRQDLGYVSEIEM
jgi:hypothetical protein